MSMVNNALRLMPPQDEEFAGADFMKAEAMDALAQELIRRHEELHFIRGGDFELQVLWKRTGGSKGGRGILGKCIAVTGLVRFYSAKDWVIWLAADHVRAFGFNAQQTEALLYHEMLHCAVEEREEGPPKITTVSHDIEAFDKEIERYGLWMEDLRRTAKVMGAQLSLPLDTPGTPD